ncbi:MAG: MarR family transcriptional regulator [Kiloniellales bacterium]|nr:MarR family transcriptional regulator [Kiloniellales bacterium]
MERVDLQHLLDLGAALFRIARGEEHPGPNDPKVWFTSTESFARILSAGNRELLRTIAERAPSSLDELAQMTGRAKSNLSRTLKKMADYGLVEIGRRRTPSTRSGH